MANWRKEPYQLKQDMEGTEKEQTQPAMPTNCKQTDIYDIHRQAVIDWHNACRAFDTARVRRDQLKAELDKISQEFYDHIQNGMHDPTDPCPVNPPVNGRSSSAGTQIPGANWSGYRDS